MATKKKTVITPGAQPTPDPVTARPVVMPKPGKNKKTKK